MIKYGVVDSEVKKEVQSWTDEEITNYLNNGLDEALRDAAKKEQTRRKNKPKYPAYPDKGDWEAERAKIKLTTKLDRYGINFKSL